jgi:hypothetical protein
MRQREEIQEVLWKGSVANVLSEIKPVLAELKSKVEDMRGYL